MCTQLHLPISSGGEALQLYWEEVTKSLPRGALPPPKVLLESSEGYSVAWLAFLVREWYDAGSPKDIHPFITDTVMGKLVTEVSGVGKGGHLASMCLACTCFFLSIHFCIFDRIPPLFPLLFQAYADWGLVLAGMSKEQRLTLLDLSFIVEGGRLGNLLDLGLQTMLKMYVQPVRPGSKCSYLISSPHRMILKV